MGTLIGPHFVAPHQNVFEGVRWSLRDSAVYDVKGKPIFTMNAVEFPETWSQLAVDIAVRQYFRKRGVPGTGHETSLKQLVDRIATTIAEFAQRELKYFETDSDREVFRNELLHLLIHQQAAFNSPVWFNCGLHRFYGITGSRGFYAINLQNEKPEAMSNAFERPLGSACFIQSIEDDLLSIFDLVKREALIFKYGAGSGTNFSKLRGREEEISGGGSSSGLISFLRVFDQGAAATQSGGTTRRAAKMVCLDVDHPEIVEFVEWKWKEEEKARTLIAAGFDSDFEGEAYRSVFGQNANNSVRVTDEFMEAVEKDLPWALRARTTGRVTQKVSARWLWGRMAEAAWACADPGVQFDTTIQSWHTCPNTDRIRASNPCSEFMFLDNTACNLASINLLRFYDEHRGFDTEGFRRACERLIVAQETLVDLSSYPTPEIAERSHQFRPLGLGYANLGALLMVMGLPYDSDEGRAWAAALTALMQGQALLTSVELARRQGPFEGFAENREAMLRVVDRHAAHAQKIPWKLLPPELQAEVEGLWKEVIPAGRKHGFRNAQTTVLAPTGTIGLLMDCDTTGIEPEFSLVKFKRLAGGGAVQIVNQSFLRSLNNLGYAEAAVNRIRDYLLEEGSLSGAPDLREEHRAIFDCAQPAEEGGRSIHPEAHLQMMAAVQPFLSGAISKTVNLPASASVDDVQNVFWKAWKLELKAVAVYRDGAKASQPLSQNQKVATRPTPLPPSASEEAPVFSPTCPICGHATVPNASCFRCENCGHSLGCS